MFSSISSSSTSTSFEIKTNCEGKNMMYVKSFEFQISTSDMSNSQVKDIQTRNSRTWDLMVDKMQEMKTLEQVKEWRNLCKAVCNKMVDGGISILNPFHTKAWIFDSQMKVVTNDYIKKDIEDKYGLETLSQIYDAETVAKLRSAMTEYKSQGLLDRDIYDKYHEAAMKREIDLHNPVKKLCLIEISNCKTEEDLSSMRNKLYFMSKHGLLNGSDCLELSEKMLSKSL